MSEGRDCTDVGLVICAEKVSELPTADAEVMYAAMLLFWAVRVLEAGVRAVTERVEGNTHSKEVV